MKVPFLDLQPQYRQIEAELMPRLSKVMADSAFVLGEEVREFEENFAEYCGSERAVGVANGTDAIILALKALGIQSGDEVITAAYTFIATVEAIEHAGAKPVLVDCDPATYTLAPLGLAKALSSRTRAVIAVHLYGRCADMDPVNAWAREHKLYVVEDAAQAHGALYKGRRAGSLGDIACFSFYPSKNLGAYGDGGAVTTNDSTLAERVLKLRDHGSTRKYDHEVVGYNSRLDSLQAAVLNVKLPRLDMWNGRRRAHAQQYHELLRGVHGITLPPLDGEVYESVHHVFVIRVAEGQRDSLRQYLAEQQIGTGIHYPAPVHMTTAFAHLNCPRGSFPVAEKCANEVLSLPMMPELTSDQVMYVAGKIRVFVEGASK